MILLRLTSFCWSTALVFLKLTTLLLGFFGFWYGYSTEPGLDRCCLRSLGAGVTFSTGGWTLERSASWKLPTLTGRCTNEGAVVSEMRRKGW